MYKVVGVSFFNSHRIYYFSVNNINDLCKKQNVIVETEKGLQFGQVVTDILLKEEKDLITPLKNVLRIATTEDILKQNNLQNLSNKALVDAKKISKELNLDMNFIDANFTFDKSQLIFNFIADDRVDFRELAKKIAAIYKTRIELRQIGVRDKAKEIGGIGPCGKFLCCNLFLNDFNSVSINMVKNQYLSLNPSKINGNCGRLLCCLNFENDQYTEMKKNYPIIGTIVKTSEITGKVISHNLLKKTFTLELPDKKIVEVSLDEKYDS